MIQFSVPSVPVPQPRQRHRVMRIGGKTIAQNYTPTSDPVNAFKSTCRMAAREVYDGPPLRGPLRVEIVAVFPRRTNRIWKTKPMPREPYVCPKDWDNIGKSVCDALNELIWADDRQIVDGRVLKYEASGDEQPHVQVTIEELA